MPITYKMNVMAALKEQGYSTYYIRKHKIMGEATVQKLRKGELVSWENIDTLCQLLGCQPGDLLRYESNFAPPGEWCLETCPKRCVCQPAGSEEPYPWCSAYAVGIVDWNDTAEKFRKCDKCLRDTP